MDVSLDDIAVPTYKGNFPRYKAELRIFLEVFSCDGFLNGTLVAPSADDASDEEKADFAGKERILWQALHRGLGGRELTETLMLCGDAPDALQLWTKFAQRKTHTTYGEHLARLDKFHNSRYERGMNVYSWIAEKIELGEMLSYGGLKISDAEMADVLLIGTHDVYPGLASDLVPFNNVGEPMPRPKLIDVMEALGEAWRLEQDTGKVLRSPRYEMEMKRANTPRAHTPKSHTPRSHTPKSQTQTPRRRAPREPRDDEERERREQERIYL